MIIVTSHKSQVTKLLNFLALLSLLFSSPTFAASSSLGASALGDISIEGPHLYELAAECVSIISEEILPEICANFIDDSLEIAVNSSYSFKEQRPATKSLNSQTLAAQISYDAKQSYLSEIENAALARKAENARGLTTYDPHQIGYMEFSTKHGFSASTKGIKVIADNEINVPGGTEKKQNNKWVVPVIATLVAGVIVLAVSKSLSSSQIQKSSLTGDPECDRTFVKEEDHAKCKVTGSNGEPRWLSCVANHIGTWTCLPS